MTLDHLRAKYPHLGFAVYAYTPGGPVTLECINQDGATFKFSGRTEDEAIRTGFPEEFEPDAPAPDLSVFE